jgi:hypothetical protein
MNNTAIDGIIQAGLRIETSFARGDRVWLAAARAGLI